MITLLGATGYTGRLVARALDRAGLPYRLAGRSPDKLAALAGTLPARPAWLAADVTQPETLGALWPGCRVLVNCAGPFTDLGEPVVAQAALNGVHYVDTTNEMGYVYRVRGYDSLARSGGAAVVPACGFEVAPADCAAAILAGEMARPLDEISIAYDLRGGGSSLGTRRSAIRALATSWLGYRDGRWVPAAPGGETRRIPFPGGERPALSFPSSEIVTVPGHVAVRRVSAWLAVTRGAAFWAPVVVPAFARLAGGPLGRAVVAAITRVAPPPEAGLRSEGTFTVLVQARGGQDRRWMAIRGRGVYDLTAEIVAYAAGQMAGAGYDRAGVLAPAAALDPRALIDAAVARWGVAVEGGEG